MSIKHNFLVVLFGIALFISAAGCSDNTENLYIIVFSKNQIQLATGQSDILNVELSTSVSKNTYIDIKNDFYCEDKLSIDPNTLTFRKEDTDETRHEVTFTGLKSTNDKYCEVRVELRDYNDYRIYKVKVFGGS